MFLKIIIDFLLSFFAYRFLPLDLPTVSTNPYYIETAVVR